MNHVIIADKMIFGSDCLARIDGKNVFVPYAVPGEKLEVSITESSRDYYRVEIVSVIEPSPHRVKPACPYYGKCGGCSMIHIDEEFQRALRKEVLKSAFEREGVSVSGVKEVFAENTGYRSRFQLNSGGLMGKKSGNVVPIEKCLCATDEVNAYLSEIPFEKRPSGRCHIFGDRRIVSIPEGFDKIVIAEEIKKELPKKTGKKSKKVKARFEGISAVSDSLCTVVINGKHITHDIRGFFQSNLNMLEKAVPLITEGETGENVMDLYSGCGTFSTFLADSFNKVCLVEHNKSALVSAEQNLYGVKHESFGVSGDVFIKYHADRYVKENGQFDMVVADPPRSGMEKSVCDWLCKSGIKKIRSLSCNAATHARDASRLIKAGYKMTDLYLLDFYPQTGEIESLAFFER